MSEIGSGSGSSYPGTLDTDTTIEVNSPSASKTKARAEVANDLAACIVAIETELGTDPAGSLTNVKTFLQTEHDADGTHGNITTGTITASGAVSGVTTLAMGGALSGVTTLAASGQITSTVATGTAPLVIASTTEVANLKAATATLATTATTATTATQVTDGTNNIRTKIINIGDWNMDSTESVSVAHGLTLANIRSVTAMVRNDADTQYYTFSGTLTIPAEVNTYISLIDATNVTVARRDTSFFDGVNYDSTSFNRGWITITYVA